MRNQIILFAATLAMTLTACGGRPSSTLVVAPSPGAVPVASAESRAQNLSEAPTFTHPTEITNPYYPVSLTGQTIALGHESGRPARNEVTLLQDTKVITWAGQQIETRVAQFVAYVDGKLVEVTYDYFAQADDGSVYYMGEDVTTWARGQIVSHNGSWLAGKDGALPAVIMPAHPQVGQVFNPENAPGVAIETAEVMSLAEKASTPDGPIDNGMLVKETMVDGAVELKIYAPNFGIVEDQSGDEKLDLVLFNRADAEPGVVPASLNRIEAQAEDIIDIVPSGNWHPVADDVTAVDGAWQAYQSRATDDKAPQAFLDALMEARDRLQKSASAKDPSGTLRAANDLSAAVADLVTLYHPVTPPDLGRLDVLERQVILDLASNDYGAAANTLAKAGAIWARLKPVVAAHNGLKPAAEFDTSLSAQQTALNQTAKSGVEAEANKNLELIDVMERLF